MSSSSEAKARIQARKIRKGTHSCWECRRRKIRCQVSAPGDLVCTPCRNRGSICRGQELADESETSELSMRHLARRLGRLEELMEKLAERCAPGSSSDLFSDVLAQEPVAFSDAGINRAELPDATTMEGPAGISTTSSSYKTSSFTSDTTHDTTMAFPRGSTIAEALCKLFPSQDDVDAILEASVGPQFVTTLFHRHADVAEGHSEPPEAIGAMPSPTSQPTVLAKRLLQLVICMQQLSPTFAGSLPSVRASMLRTMEQIIDGVDKFITPDLSVSTLEGLECLLLLGYWQQNAGNLRKAWLIFRRALSIGQLMGINAAPVSSPATAFASQYSPSPEMLWFRSVACDRYLSLLLGLPAGSHDNSFAAQPHTARDTPWEKLEKLHAVVSEKMIERNTSNQEQAYRLTQSISRDLLAGQGLMGQEWWELPLADAEQSPRSVPEVAGRMILQMNHHFLLILLHIPYLLPSDSLPHDQQGNRAICTSSSHNVLERFRAFRSLNDSAFSCRHVDYAALVAAMTLLVSHAQPGVRQDERSTDRALVTAVRDRMKDLAYLNSDKLFQQSTDVIDRLLPLLDPPEVESPSTRSQHPSSIELQIPYFGTINIPMPRASNPARKGQDLQGLDRLVQPTDSGTGTPTGSAQSADNYAMEPFVPIQFHPENQQSSFSVTDITAGADAWALQGIDATYWALLQMDWNS